MDKEKSKFFVFCPSCKKKFGIYPETVFKYVDRIVNQLQEEYRNKDYRPAKRQFYKKPQK